MEIKLYNGDCLEVMKTLPDNSVDSVVTDPPYGLSFMGKKWDCQVPSVDIWKECLRVLKPGGYLLAFAGTRTQHRMAVNIEDAGFEIRDMIVWAYGSGFPKSLDISKAIDKLLGAEREVVGEKQTSGTKRNCMAGDFSGEYNATEPATEPAKKWQGWGSNLKPAIEPITVARKPISEKTLAENVLKYGTGGLNIDESRVEINPEIDDPCLGGKGQWNIKREQNKNTVSLPAKTMGSSEEGRFPANLIHDNSEEVRECFPETKSGDILPHHVIRESENTCMSGKNYARNLKTKIGDSGNASRFFKSIVYQAKASKTERNMGRCEKQNHHPTVKPVALMEYLINMVTQKDGTVLDPFMGSGTTGIAAKKLKRNFIGIELEKEYCEIAEKRIASVPKGLKLKKENV